MRTAFFAFRVAAAPLVRTSAAVSAVCRLAMAAATVASAGEGVGNEALPVIPSTTLFANVMRTLMRLGRSRTAKLLWALLVVVEMGTSEWLRELRFRSKASLRSASANRVHARAPALPAQVVVLDDAMLAANARDGRSAAALTAQRTSATDGDDGRHLHRTKASMRLGGARTARLLIVSFVVLSMRITSYLSENLAFSKREQTLENRRRHATDKRRTVAAWNRTLADWSRTLRDWLRTFLLRTRTFFAPARPLDDPNPNPTE